MHEKIACDHHHHLDIITTPCCHIFFSRFYFFRDRERGQIGSLFAFSRNKSKTVKKLKMRVPFKAVQRLTQQQRRCGAILPSSSSSSSSSSASSASLSLKSCFHSSVVVPEKIAQRPWADPYQRQYKFWNRETSVKDSYSYLIDISPESIQREAKILSLADPKEPADEPLHKGKLPLCTTLLGVGTSLQDFEHLKDQKPNVVFMCPSCPKAAETLPRVLETFPSIEWVHCRSAGIDFVESDQLQTICSQRDIRITNAKGQFSSSLAEYVMMACSYFAKDLPRLMANQNKKTWDNYDVEELRGKTLGIVGYGDIGKACARLANVYGMQIIALRRHPFLSKDDPLCDVVYGTDKASLNKLMSESDYIVCSAPSTTDTRGMVNADAFASVKKNAVFINLGRGPVVDEKALLEALKSGRLKGAALVRFCLLKLQIVVL